MRKFRFIAVLFSLLFTSAAQAEVMLMIQGYLGNNDSWRSSGVAKVLVDHGWHDGGRLWHGPRGVQLESFQSRGNRTFYTVSLDSQAPLLVQSRQFMPYVHFIRARHEGESLVLAGHSAGGVLARLFMIENPKVDIRALVTVASPHLGTEMAELGVLAGQSPLSWFAPLFGAEELNRSQGLYYDLSRERPGSLLFWLNRQPHPDARYVSIVRADESMFGDMIVPTWSQDMNQIYALRGRAETVPVGGGHGLLPEDGMVLLRVLQAQREI